MKFVSRRYPKTIILIMFLLIGFNLLTTITTAKYDTELVYTEMNINISRKLLRVPLRNNIPPSPRGNENSRDNPVSK
ncbi:hypothetical protein MKW98_002940 [Papaver atlanticum]|uniref:Uncharacterized protein n=1 Tax=Papaver atlanticum TaxID=357466 RepID=A0AAD4T336_9MAGN|nr:hypothetical protein MKW98_002940 [Papaver atlanticum]